MALSEEEFLQIYKSETNLKKRDRLLAVFHLVYKKKSIPQVAEMLCKQYNTIKNWLKRFMEKGIDGLIDKPRSGRPPIIKNHKITEYIENRCEKIFPKQLRHSIKRAFGVSYSESSIRKKLRAMDMTRKVPQNVHIRKASVDEILEWQKAMKSWIARMKRDGFEVFVADETILINDFVAKAGPWSPIGERVYGKYSGKHERVVIFGAISESGKKMFTYTKSFKKQDFIDVLQKLIKRHRKVALILDKLSTHRAAEVEELIRKNPGKLRIQYFPTGCPELNRIEGDWGVVKAQPFMFEYYENADERAELAIEFLKKNASTDGVIEYLFRTPITE